MLRIGIGIILQYYNCFLRLLHLGLLDGFNGGIEVIDLSLHDLLVFLKLDLDPLQVLHVLSHLGHGIGVLLAEGRGSGFRLQRCLLQLPAQLQQLTLPLLILLDLGTQVTVNSPDQGPSSYMGWVQ